MKAHELKGKNFLKLLDFTPEEIQGFIDFAIELKAMKKAGTPHRYCEGKNIVLLFEKDSTRTRCAFEVAGADLQEVRRDRRPRRILHRHIYHPREDIRHNSLHG